MDRPLWQILLSIFVVAMAFQRGAAGVIWSVSELAPQPLAAAYGLQVLLGLATALGIWMGRRWVLPVLVALGVSVAATALFESLFLDLRPLVAALSQVLVAGLATGALFLVLRHEFDPASGPPSP